MELYTHTLLLSLKIGIANKRYLKAYENFSLLADIPRVVMNNKSEFKNDISNIVFNLKLHENSSHR